MKESSAFPPTLSFGVYALDPRTGELRKQGMKIKLHGQPVEILAMLLERPGDVVTREELQKKLWPSDTFVDFEQGLNAAIKRLRAALDDDAENPRFVETLPRLGYRFIGKVDSVAGAPATSSAPRQLQTDGFTRRAVASLVDAVMEAQRSRKRWRRWTLAAAILVLGVAATLVGQNVRGVRDRLFRKPAATQIRSLAVLPLENLSHDPSQDYFADGMTDELITQLAKIGALRVISRSSVMRYRGVQKSAAEIGRELDVDAVVEGTVIRSGDRVRITAQLVQAATDRHLWAQEYERDFRDILALQSDVARDIAREISIRLTP